MRSCKVLLRGLSVGLALAAGTGRTPAACFFLRGDSNTDGKVDLSDGVFTLSFLFMGGSAPGCLDAADADDSGDLNITDAIYTFSFLFLGGPEIPSPGFDTCGGDPTKDSLDCASHEPCSDACDGNACCPPGSYCAKAVGDCDGEGVCKERPAVCPRLWEPVCGCNGKTYANACEAAAAGVNVAYEGECKDLGCKDNGGCPEGSYCAKEEGDCNGRGECRERPFACPDLWDPVCGCDGRTYANACEAAAAGVNVASHGACVPEVER